MFRLKAPKNTQKIGEFNKITFPVDASGTKKDTIVFRHNGETTSIGYIIFELELYFNHSLEDRETGVRGDLLEGCNRISKLEIHGKTLYVDFDWPSPRDK